MSSRVKVGVVGCGKIATSVHMPSIEKIQGYNLVAASDLNPARLEEELTNVESKQDKNGAMLKSQLEAADSKIY